MKYIEEKSRSGISYKKFDSAFGKKILAKFGWNEGEGLGKKKDGITDIVQIKRREENQGLGKEVKKTSWSDKWWENTYDNILKTIKPKKENKIVKEGVSSEETQPERKKDTKVKGKSKSYKGEDTKMLNKKRKITYIKI